MSSSDDVDDTITAFMRRCVASTCNWAKRKAGYSSGPMTAGSASVPILKSSLLALTTPALRPGVAALRARQLANYIGWLLHRTWGVISAGAHLRHRFSAVAKEVPS